MTINQDYNSISSTISYKYAKEIILILLFIIFHMNYCEPTFATPCILWFSFIEVIDSFYRITVFFCNPM